MQSSARRDGLRELVLLARVAEPGSNNLGEFVANHADELAQALDVDAHRLALARALDDEELLPRILQLLERARRRSTQEDLDRRRERSIAAAERLGQTVRWTELGAELDVDLLLGEVLADRTPRLVSFEGEGLAVAIPRQVIAATRLVARQHLDVGAFVDEHGLHFRWRAGRGRYNWRPQSLRPGLESRVLTVPLGPNVEPIVLPEVMPDGTAANDVNSTEPDPIPVVVPVVAAMPERRRGGAWLRDILRELRHV
jgi:hypothetical protein